jgi:hypothetical protein
MNFWNFWEFILGASHTHTPQGRALSVFKHIYIYFNNLHVREGGCVCVRRAPESVPGIPEKEQPMKLADIHTRTSRCCQAPLEVVPEPAGSVHHARANCATCGRFHDWIARPRVEEPEHFDDGDEWHELDDVELLGESERALFIAGEHGKSWVPKSQVIREASDLPGQRRGSLTVTRWFARKARWLERANQ